MNILGIESSCDETAVAVVRDGWKVLASQVYSQVQQHAAHGGVVPEIAARSHMEVLPGLIESTLAESDLNWDGIDAIAVTYGPGLASSLLVGLSAAKSLALATGKPLLPVNHLEAHLYSVFLGDQHVVPNQVCPMLTLLVSGGNTCLVHVRGISKYQVLGQTLDDAAGEALDKGAVLLGLGYPGGSSIEQEAKGGNATFRRFPRGLEQDRCRSTVQGHDRDLCFSFSGLKTSLLYFLRKNPCTLEAHRSDVAASYQEAVFDALMIRVGRGLRKTESKTFALVGGVARNQVLRRKIDEQLSNSGTRLLLAAPEYCTDNAAMIAGLAGAPGGVQAFHDPMMIDIQPSLEISASS